jgi:hypothetical protein
VTEASLPFLSAALPLVSLDGLLIGAATLLPAVPENSSLRVKKQSFRTGHLIYGNCWIVELKNNFFIRKGILFVD